MSRRQHQLGTIDKLDITPLVDLTFLLLIVFMITAPVLEYTVDVSPPELNAEQVDEDEHRIVTLDSDGKVHLGDAQLTYDELTAELAQLASTQPELPIFIRADQARPYGDVVKVMKTVRRSGMVNFSLITASEDLP